MSEFKNLAEVQAAMKADILALIVKHFPEIDQSKISFDFEKFEILIADLPDEYNDITILVNSVFKNIKQGYKRHISRFN